MSWRSRRKLDQIAAVLEWAIPGAEEHPIPTDLGEFIGHRSSVYVGDKVAMVQITNILKKGKPRWATEDSVSAWLLRDIWGVVSDHWSGHRPEGASPAESVQADMLLDRGTLVRISWLIASARERWEARPGGT